MNDVLNSGAFSLASLIVSMVVLVVGLALWFFVNRASSRANEQIELLEALLDQQKRQNAFRAMVSKLWLKARTLSSKFRTARKVRLLLT